MSAKAEYINRQVIPRWHPFRIARILGYTNPARQSQTPKFISVGSYQEKQTQWQLNKSISYALDFLGTALLVNDLANPEARRACEFIFSNRDQVSRLGFEIALAFVRRIQHKATGKSDSVIHEPSIKARSAISSIRHHVHTYPNDPIAWVDLAFYYTVLAQKDKAARCINVALGLAPENRFVLRAAVRFQLHIGEPDKAMRYLRRASRTAHDPWLISAEISMSEAIQKQSKFIKMGQVMSKNSSFHPRDRSELCASLGTLEVHHGAVKKARKLFKYSLIEPNENTIAQFEWIRPAANIDLDSRRIEVPGLFRS